MKIDQRGLLLECFSKSNIFMVPWVGTTIAIEQKSVRSEAVVIRTFGGGSDTQGNFIEGFRLENPLGADEGNSLATELEPLGKDRPRDHILPFCRNFRQPVKRSQSNFCIYIGQKDTTLPGI